MLQRGVVVSDETIRQWCATFGQVYANRCAGAGPGLATNGISMKSSSKINAHDPLPVARSTSTAVCSTFLVQSRRHAVGAIKFFRRLLTGLRYVPRVLVTDRLASTGRPTAW